MSEHYFRQLLDDYVAGQLSEAGKKQFFDFLEEEPYRAQLEKALHQEWNEGSYEEEPNPQIAGLIERFVLDKITERKPAVVRTIPFFKRYKWVAAAVILFAIAGIVWVITQRRDIAVNNIAEEKKLENVDIPPGRNGALLTLDNGDQIVLDSIDNGLVAKQGNSNIVKQGDKLSYQSSSGAQETSFNTLTTPKGRQYPNLILADGTKVWLDAGSSIRFPVAFTGNERRVEITGQVWFDVIHNSQKPFKVIARGVEINDLGTEFNVNAYDNEEKLKVTLLKGVISIQSQILKPGSQAQVAQGGQMQIVNNINTADVVAWKNGFFSFNATDVNGIMRQLSRWYDIEVRYEGIDPTATFTGKIDRSLNLSEVLKVLEKTGVHFRIEGKRKLIILP